VTNAGDEFLTLSPQMSPTCHPYHSVLLMATDDNQHSIHNLAYHKLRFTMPSTIAHPVCRKYAERLWCISRLVTAAAEWQQNAIISDRLSTYNMFPFSSAKLPRPPHQCSSPSYTFSRSRSVDSKWQHNKKHNKNL